MVLKEFVVVLCLARVASAVPYQYNGYPSSLSTPSFLGKQNLHSDLLAKFNVGYKSPEPDASAKVKKEFGDGDYHAVFGLEGGLKRPYTEEDFLSFDGHDGHTGEDYSTTAGPLARYPYVDYSTVAYSTPKPAVPEKSSTPATAASKVFIPHHGHHGHYHHPKHHFVHDVVGHYISDVAGHKIRHVGEVLESGALNEPIIHKLNFAKAVLLPLVAIIGSLSAINGIHFVARASDPHTHEHGHAAGAGAPDHDEGFGHSHHPNTLVGLIYHFVAQLSKFNTEAKVHLIPNLLRIVSKTSSSSAHASGHHGRRRR